MLEMSSTMLEMDSNNNAQPVSEKCYSLRPRSLVKRSDEEEEEIITWKRRPKKRSKPKPAPLSKYRRKTANARERSRMREINEAFDSLRRAVPHAAGMSSDKVRTHEISTLRLAMSTSRPCLLL
uniref:Helix-loop-helix protein delilah n=1 Tax=Lygus hesperus TaxID=30085 RepID=A0A0A9XWQ9_LYGHE